MSSTFDRLLGTITPDKDSHRAAQNVAKGFTSQARTFNNPGINNYAANKIPNVAYTKIGYSGNF